MSRNLVEKSSDSINDILSSIKLILEEKSEDSGLYVNKVAPNISRQYALDSYKSQAEYVRQNHPNFKQGLATKDEHKGAEVLTVDDAIDNLARQIGIPENNAVKEEDLSSMLGPLNHLNDSAERESKKPQQPSSSENLIFQSAMEEVNGRLRQLIAQWLRDNLPSLVKQIIHEEMSKVLKNIKL